MNESKAIGVQDATERLYRNKVILAPMVRAGSLPFRVLALKYGADTVFTEEVIDRRVVNAVRTENRLLGTVDYVEARGKKPSAVPFQTCVLERDRLVYQIGTGDSVHALRAAQHVERDVAAVDINMGCPKRFSLQGGMGAALLKRPEVAADIVRTLKRNLSVPVSVKIRLLDSPSETVEFARRMEKAGACALTVHVRQLEDKPASKARWGELRPVVDAINIPVIANGDVYTRGDMETIKSLSGCSSVMLARPALLNCSIFKPDGKMAPLTEVIQDYLRQCIRFDSIYQNAKYTVMEMITKRRHPDHLKESIRIELPKGSPGMPEVTAAKTLQQLAVLWSMGDDYRDELERRRLLAERVGAEATATATAERSSVHRFDDSYFLEPARSTDTIRDSACAALTGNGAALVPSITGITATTTKAAVGITMPSAVGNTVNTSIPNGRSVGNPPSPASLESHGAPFSCFYRRTDETNRGLEDGDRGERGATSELGREGRSGTGDPTSACATPQTTVMPIARVAATLERVVGNNGSVEQNLTPLAPVTLAGVKGGGVVGVDTRIVGLTKGLTSDCSSCEGQTSSTVATVMSSTSSKRPRVSEN